MCHSWIFTEELLFPINYETGESSSPDEQHRCDVWLSPPPSFGCYVPVIQELGIYEHHVAFYKIIY